MGVDSWDTDDGAGYRADAVMVLVMDREARTIQPIMISRDTMTTVDVYNDQGTYAFSGTMHLNMQYLFGRTAEESCRLMEQTVSNLLQGMPIDRYCSITLQGIAEIVDAMGGITLVLPEDCTDLDPTWTEGATIPLNGEQAVYFLQHRDTEMFASNNGRMDRQSWFLKEVFRQVAELPALRLLTIYNTVKHDLTTDMNLMTMYEISQCSLAENALRLPGTDVEGELHDEFYVDDRALKALLIQIFYDRAA
ncbi:MAG: LCP family protein [Lachnospiraceae bacterium]|nr:LCP family protein [Lachnospiraceae bacterium]